MSLWLLFKDEMKGFYKSKVMLVLWFGMPIISFLFHYFQPDTEGIPVSSLVALLISSLGGILASVVLSTAIVNEKNRHVYELFLIRPVKRRNLLLAKFLAVYFCLFIATLISIITGLLIDWFTIGIPAETFLRETFESVSISLAAMAISSSIGILIGTLASSVALAAILSIYIGNQLSLILMLPTIFIEKLEPLIYAPPLGITITVGVLLATIMIFNRKQF
ncbi:MAG: ABC transporter permease subunit [Candidatus Lokiarchaeota archaeon]|nr:ABC transporter permease subunit [Candidatus Lokiarchaeota archaeon]